MPQGVVSELLVWIAVVEVWLHFRLIRRQSDMLGRGSLGFDDSFFGRRDES
jgi:hypothetical protein